MVDAVWLQVGMSVRAPFLDILASQYDAGVHVADFKDNPNGVRVNINNFAGDATKVRIADLIPPGAIDESTRYVLLNAAYLKASWEYPFAKEGTRDGNFRVASGTQVTVPMMHKVTAGLRYAVGPNFQAVELPYVGGDLKMLIVLPVEGQLQAVRNSMDDALFRALAWEQRGIDLSLPKFRTAGEPRNSRRPWQRRGCRAHSTGIRRTSTTSPLTKSCTSHTYCKRPRRRRASGSTSPGRKPRPLRLRRGAGWVRPRR